MTWAVLVRLVPWRYVANGLGAVALLALGWRVSVWHDAYKALPEAQAALEREVACEVRSKCAERVAAITARQAAVSQQGIRL